MSDDPAGVLAVVCTTVCLQLIGGFCLDFASISKSPRALVSHVFDFPLQLTHAPAVSAHGHPAMAPTTTSKMRIRENGISSYQSPRRRGEPPKPRSSKSNPHRIQQCRDLNLLHDPPSFACMFSAFYSVSQVTVLYSSRQWVTTAAIDRRLRLHLPDLHTSAKFLATARMPSADLFNLPAELF
jgi:hypothetical protein